MCGLAAQNPTGATEPIVDDGVTGMSHASRRGQESFILNLHNIQIATLAGLRAYHLKMKFVLKQGLVYPRLALNSL